MDFTVIRQLLDAMVKTVDFDDDANRTTATHVCEQLIQETCLMAYVYLLLYCIYESVSELNFATAKV